MRWWSRLSGWLVGCARLSEADRAQIAEAGARGGAVIYVLLGTSLIDSWVLRATLHAAGLAQPEYAVGLSGFFLTPWRWLSALVRGRLASPSARLRAIVERRGAALLFLGAPKTLVAHRQPGTARALEPLLASGAPLQFVPLALIWSRDPDAAHRSWMDVLLGDAGSPGMLRKLWLYIWYRGRTLLKAAPPLDLRVFEGVAAPEGEAPPAARESASARGRLLLGELRRRIVRERRVVTGPRPIPSWRLGETVLRSQAVREVVGEVSAAEQCPTSEIHGRASAIVREVSANFKLWMIRFLAVVMRLIFRRIYRGIDLDRVGLARVRDAARGARLCLVPSHKSHVDYLVLSYIFFREGLFPPHIAAGDNLSFWPLGWIFRRAGAFFLRRSFKGDHLYATVFRTYVKALLRAGYPIEFFIEGGRSRSGKLLAPKLGMLSMVVDAYRTSASREEVAIVPVSISYDRVVEADSYVRELSGGEKRREDPLAVVRAGRALLSRYGRVEVRFAEPIQLGEYLAGRGLSRSADDEAALRDAVAALGHRILFDINRATPVTGAAMVATALLSGRGRGMPLDDVRARSRAFLTLAERLGGRPAGALDQKSAWDLGALELLERSRFIRRETIDGVPFVLLDDDARLALDFFKNTALHLFSEMAVAAVACGDRDRARALSKLWRREFAFRSGRTFDDNWNEAVKRLASLPSPVEVRDVAMLLLPLSDAYQGTFATVASRSGEAMSRRDWSKRILAALRQRAMAGVVRAPEAISQALVDNALSAAEEEGLLARDEALGLMRSTGLPSALIGALAN